MLHVSSSVIRTYEEASDTPELTRGSLSKMARQDVVKKMAKYEDFFVNVMMVEELGLQVPSPDDDIVKEGTYSGFAYPPILLPSKVHMRGCRRLWVRFLVLGPLFYCYLHLRQA